jgi:hypothetical protein
MHGCCLIELALPSEDVGEIIERLPYGLVFVTEEFSSGGDGFAEQGFRLSILQFNAEQAAETVQ